MNSKLLINKALSLCLIVVTVAAYSMVALANSEKIAGELFVNGKIDAGQSPVVKINGETAKSGGSVFTGSTIATPEDASAIVSIGKIGKVELAPNTVMSLSFNEKGVNGNLSAGRITVLDTSNTVSVKMADGNAVNLKTGESASAANEKAAQDDNDRGRYGSSFALFALILGGAIAGLIIAATRANNKSALGGSTTVISTIR